MKKLLILLAISLPLMHCKNDDTPVKECSVAATVRNFSQLDACGYVLELDNGNILEPVMSELNFKSEGPGRRAESPVYSQHFEDGQKVWIEYTPVEWATACMAGQTVEITCIRKQ